MKYYPIALNLKNFDVLVVGGGKVAERKVVRLLEVGALVRIVSPEIIAKLDRLVKEKKIAWTDRAVQKKDVHGVAIVIAATNDKHINEKVSYWAREKRIWINVVDNKNLSDFISPTILRKGKALIAVYSDGREPVFSRDLKNYLKEHWNDFLSYRRGL